MRFRGTKYRHSVVHFVIYLLFMRPIFIEQPGTILGTKEVEQNKEPTRKEISLKRRGDEMIDQ